MSKPHTESQGVLILGGVLLSLVLCTILDGMVLHEAVPPEQWAYWDLGSLAWVALVFLGGWALARSD